MPNRPISPPDIAPPAAQYVHAVVTTTPARTLRTSGVVPVDPDGNVPPDVSGQAATVWANIAVILEEAGMETTDIVNVTTYTVVGTDLAPVMAARDRAFDGHLAASTLVTVPALARPEWLVEVSVEAVRA